MFVLSNLATSVDGKIATRSRVHFPLGTPEDRRMMQQIRKKSDAIVMGASSLRAFKGPLLIKGARRQPINAIVSSRLDGVSPDWKFFREKSIRRVLFVSTRAPKARLRQFAETCEIRVLKPGAVAPQILRELARMGATRLLVEGGGALMWDFVSLNLIDEYYVTLTPRLLGGTEAPTLVDGPGLAPSAVVNLKLARCRRVGDELYLVYRKTAHRGP